MNVICMIHQDEEGTFAELPLEDVNSLNPEHFDRMRNIMLMIVGLAKGDAMEISEQLIFSEGRGTNFEPFVALKFEPYSDILAKARKECDKRVYDYQFEV